MIWEIVYTRNALSDLDGIYEYISNVLLEPGIAKSLVSHIIKEVRGLNQMPHRHHLAVQETLRAQGIRIMSVKKYLVIYLPCDEDKTVQILRIIYGGRDISKQLIETE